MPCHWWSGNEEPEARYYEVPAPEPIVTEGQSEMEKLLTEYAKQYGTQYVPGATFPGMEKITMPSEYEKLGYDLIGKYLKTPSVSEQQFKQYIETPSVGEQQFKQYIETPSVGEKQLAEYIKSPGTAVPLIEKFIQGGIPELLGQTKEQIAGLLKPEEYDPYQSESYKGTLKEIEKQRAQSVSRIKNLLAAQGQRKTGYETGRYLEAEENVFDRVSDVIAEISERERARKLNTIMQLIPTMSQIAGQEMGIDLTKIGAAQQLDVSELDKIAQQFGLEQMPLQKIQQQFELEQMPLQKIQQQFELEQIPLQKAQTALQAGGLERSLAQIGYEDFMRKQGELAGTLGVATNVLNVRYPMAQTQIPYFSQPEAPGWTKITGFVGDIAGMIPHPLAQGASLVLKGATALGGGYSSGGVGQWIQQPRGAVQGGVGGGGGTYGQAATGPYAFTQ